MEKITELELKDLEAPHGLLPRVLTGTVEGKVQEYAELLEEGVEFDPILVWRREDGRYWVIDGVHRIEAHKRAGRERIKAKLVKCKDKLDYRIKTIQANLKHGLALAKGERPILAQTLYRQGLSEKEIRRVFGVSLNTVRKWLAPVKQEEKQKKIRKAIELKEKGRSLREIAKELDMTPEGVRKLLSTFGKNCQKLTLLTPDGTPTPEGIRLFEEHLRSQDRLPPAWNYENFRMWLEREGKKVEGNIKEFVSCFTKLISEVFKTFAKEKEEDYEAVKRYLSAKEPFSKLSAQSREKLFAWAKRYWDKELKKVKKRREAENKVLSVAEEVLKDPEYTFTGWTDLSKEVTKRTKLSFEEVNSVILKHTDNLMEVYRRIPEVPEEKVREILEKYDLEEFESLKQLIATIKASIVQEGYRWTQKAERTVIEAYSSRLRPSSPASAGSQPAPSDSEVEKVLQQVRAGVRWIYTHLGKEKALEVLEKIREEIETLSEIRKCHVV